MNSRNCLRRANNKNRSLRPLRNTNINPYEQNQTKSVRVSYINKDHNYSNPSLSLLTFDSDYEAESIADNQYDEISVSDEDILRGLRNEDELSEFSDIYDIKTVQHEGECFNQSQAISFKFKLAKSAIINNISLTNLSALLKILIEDGKYIDLLRDARSFLKTPRKNPVREMSNGHYIHFGIKIFLAMYLGNTSISTYEIIMSFSTDGTPVSISGANSLWPIFGAIHIGDNKREVFIVGLFNDSSKPESFNEFLTEFVDELCDLTKSEFQISNQTYVIKIKSFVADAPALAYLKNCKSHGGYSACTKCEVRGVNIPGTSKIVYPQLNAPLRTDLKFRCRLSDTENDDHHMGTDCTVLEKLPIDIIRDFPLDKMHLLDEGVVKKIMVALIGKVNPQKLMSKKLMLLNKRIERCAEFMPIEFARRPRTLKYVLKMKATEYRSFLLYIGPAVLENIVPKETYNHFLTLSLAIRILSTPSHHLKYNDYANKLLNSFVKLFPRLYGMKNVTYNVHGLIHLASDVKTHGPLDTYSCYVFESYIKILKKMLNAQNKPLQQIYNRFQEKAELTLLKINNLKSLKSGNYFELTNKIYGKTIYLTRKVLSYTIRGDKDSDNCIMLRKNCKDTIILRVKYFQKDEDEIYIYGQILIDVRPLSNKWCLKEFSIVMVNFENKLTKHSSNIFICKMCLFPYNMYNAEYFVCPLIHHL